jgi:hypothetical protein
MNVTSSVTGRATALTGAGAGSSTDRGDLVAWHRRSREIVIHPHRGFIDGTDTFGPPVTVISDIGAASWLGVGDFTGNRRADIYQVRPDGTAGLRLNLGGPHGRDSFAPWVELDGHPSAGSRADRVLADITGNGRVDVVYRRAGARQTEVGLNVTMRNGLPVWSEPKPLAFVRDTETVIGTGDVTGMGRPDIVVRDSRGGTVTVYEFVDDPADPRGVRRYVVATGLRPDSRLHTGTVCGSGLPDLIEIRGDGALVVRPHSGVFWPQDPLTTFTAPICVGENWDQFDIIG